MSNVNKPTPITSWYDEVDQTEHQCVTIDQAEYYAAERVRDALEQAAGICDAVNNYDHPMTAQDCADRIRALIPKE